MSNTTCAGIISNPDLAGIGTRVNLYATILLTALVPENKYTTKLLDSLYLNAVFYGLALLITALVQTIQRRLDLYHAIIVMQVILALQFLHGFGMGRYVSAHKFGSKMKMTITVQIVSLIIFYPWSFYMWANVSRFGPQPECNDLVKFVLVFYTFQATVLWARYLCMTILAMTTFALLCNLTVIFIVRKVHHEREKEKEREREREKEREKEKEKEREEEKEKLSSSGSDTEKDIEKGSETANEKEPERKSRRGILKWFGKTTLWVVSVLSVIVCVASTEMTVHRNIPNVQAGEGAWGFGQIVSVIIILPGVIEILVALDKWNIRRRQVPEQGNNK